MFDPIVIKKALNARFAKAMLNLLTKVKDSKGILKAALEIDSKAAYENLGWIGSLPVVQQWLGELDVKGFNNYEFVVKNLDWAVAAPIHENHVEDDQIGLLKRIAAMLVKRIMQHPAKLIISLLISGDSNKAYDGKAFFDSSNRSFSNMVTGSGVTLAQLEADLNKALINMATVDDGNGEPLDIKADMIVCPVALENSFRKLVNSKSSPTASGGIDTFNPFEGRFEVIADPRLDKDDNKDWYLLCTSEEVQPFIFQKRQKSKNRFWNKEGTKTWIYSADYRGNGAYGLPHLASKIVNA